MAAPLTVWMGRSGSGKSTRLYDRLIAHAQKGERATLVVAEQYTFEAEKALCSRLGGLLGVQVLSFSRLCERVLQERGAELPVIGGIQAAVGQLRGLTQAEQLAPTLPQAFLFPWPPSGPAWGGSVSFSQDESSLLILSSCVLQEQLLRNHICTFSEALLNLECKLTSCDLKYKRSLPHKLKAGSCLPSS